MFREHCQSAGEGKVWVTRDVEAADVLLGDVGIRTHVNDVDPVDAVIVLQVFDAARDDAPRYEAFPSPVSSATKNRRTGLGP